MHLQINLKELYRDGVYIGIQRNEMVSIDTYRARVAKEMFHHGIYQPDRMRVSDLADAIVGGGDRQIALQAIRMTALDDFSPVVYVRGSNQRWVTLGRGPSADINEEIREWIIQWDKNELPPELGD